MEVFVDTPLEECETRDTKGLYKKARAGIIKGFTGIDQPYEKPDNPEVTIKTVEKSVLECVEKIISVLRHRGILPKEHVDNDGELFVSEELKEQITAEAEGLRSVEINKIDFQWLQVLSEGWAKPLRGFMREKEFLQCQHFNCIADGAKDLLTTSQSIPIVLPITTSDKERMEGVRAITLRYQGRARAILRHPEFYQHRKEERVARQFGTTNINHPYIY